MWNILFQLLNEGGAVGLTPDRFTVLNELMDLESVTIRGYQCLSTERQTDIIYSWSFPHQNSYEESHAWPQKPFTFITSVFRNTEDRGTWEVVTKILAVGNSQMNQFLYKRDNEMEEEPRDPKRLRVQEPLTNQNGGHFEPPINSCKMHMLPRPLWKWNQQL